MSRDLVLAGLILCVCGSLTVLVGLLSFHRASPVPEPSGMELERRAWRRLWTPILPALAAMAALVGWAAQEPRTTDELLPPWTFALAVPLSVVLLRAVWRALTALRNSGHDLPAVTVGILRPRVRIDRRLGDLVPAASLAAVRAHEDAHARHHDPLRIWLAQTVTDLQWPSRQARSRLREWLSTLELARDEEARRDGATGEDLAAAIIAAARWKRGGHPGATATLTYAEIDLARRIHRLLGDLPPPPQAARSWTLFGLLGALLLAICGLGLLFGDAIVRALPIVTT